MEKETGKYEEKDMEGTIKQGKGNWNIWKKKLKNIENGTIDYVKYGKGNWKIWRKRYGGNYKTRKRKLEHMKKETKIWKS